MTRPAGAVVTLLCFLPTASATVARPKPPDRPAGLKASVTREMLTETEEVPPPAEARMTADTAVFLDGRRCEYKNVPATATVVRMVLAPDGATVTRIEFRTRK